MVGAPGKNNPATMDRGVPFPTLLPGRVNLIFGRGDVKGIQDLSGLSAVRPIVVD